MTEAIARNGSRIGKRTTNGRRRLSEEAKAEILRLARAGEGAAELANRYGVDRSRIYQIVSGRTAVRDGRIGRRPLTGTHAHTWMTEADLTWCPGCGAER